MSIHTIAIHNRAQAARAEASAAALRLHQVLLEHIADGTCPPAVAPDIATFAAALSTYSPATGRITTPERAELYLDGLMPSSNIGGAHRGFRTAQAAAVDLTKAAQTLEPRVTLE